LVKGVPWIPKKVLINFLDFFLLGFGILRNIEFEEREKKVKSSW